MILVKEAIIEMQVKRLIKKKVENSLCKMEADLKRELANNGSNKIDIKFGKDEESCKYIIKINNEQIKFTIDDITKVLMETSKDNEIKKFNWKLNKKINIV